MSTLNAASPTHASRHAIGGPDAVSPASIGAPVLVGGKVPASQTQTLDAISSPVASVSFNGQRATGLAAPAAATDGVRPQDLPVFSDTAIVLGSNVPAWMKALAGWMPNVFLATGTLDESTVASAVTFVRNLISAGNFSGGSIRFIGDLYFTGPGVAIDTSYSITFRGTGRKSSVIHLTSTFYGAYSIAIGSGASTSAPGDGSCFEEFKVDGSAALAARPATTLAGSTLDVPVPGTSETIQVASTTGHFVGETLELGWTNYEEVQITAVVDTTHITVIRGANGTTPQAWNPAATGGVPVVPRIGTLVNAASAAHNRDVEVVSAPGTGLQARPWNWANVTYLSGAITTGATSLPVTATRQPIPDGAVITILTTPGSGAERVVVSNGGSAVAAGATSIPVTRAQFGTTAVAWASGAQVQAEPQVLFDQFQHDVRVQACGGDQIAFGTNFWQGNFSASGMNNSECHKVHAIGANHYSPSTLHRGRSGFYCRVGGFKKVDTHAYYNQWNAIESRPETQSLEIMGGEYETSGQSVAGTGGVGFNAIAPVRVTLKAARFYQNDSQSITLQSVAAQAQVTVDDVSVYLIPTTCGVAASISATNTGTLAQVVLRGVKVEGTGATGLGAAVSVTNLDGVKINQLLTASIVPNAHEVVLNNAKHTKITDTTILLGIKETGVGDYNVADIEMPAQVWPGAVVNASGQTSTDTTLTVGANSLTNGRTLLNPATGEQITITSGGGTTSLVVVRGANNTLPAAIAANQTLTQIPDVTAWNINGHSRIVCRDGRYAQRRWQFTVPGDGTTTSFTVPHGLMAAPTVLPMVTYNGSTGAALAQQYVVKASTSPGTSFLISFPTAPPSGVTYTFTADADCYPG